MVICLELGADLHMAQLMPLLLTASWFSKIQIAFTFLVLAHPGSPAKGPQTGVCVCVYTIHYFSIKVPMTRIHQAIPYVQLPMLDCLTKACFFYAKQETLSKQSLSLS